MDVLVFLALLAVICLISFLVVRAQWRRRVDPQRFGPGSGTAYGEAGYLDFDRRDGGDSGASCGGGSGGD